MVVSVLRFNIAATRFWLYCSYSREVVFPWLLPKLFIPMVTAHSADSKVEEHHISTSVTLSVTLHELPFFHSSSPSASIEHLLWAWWHVGIKSTRWVKHGVLCSSWRDTRLSKEMSCVGTNTSIQDTSPWRQRGRIWEPQHRWRSSQKKWHLIWIS